MFMGSDRVCTIVFGFGLTILAWSLLFDPKAEHSTKSHKVFLYVAKLLVAFFMVAAIWLFIILLVKLMASTCHLIQFFEKIQGSILDQFVLEMFLGLL